MYGRVAYPCRSPRFLDNLINLVSSSLPTFFAAATKFLLCVPSILAPLRFARLFTPSLSLSVFFSLNNHRQLLSLPLICTTDHGINGSVSRRDRYRVRGRRWRDAYRDSGWRDHSKFIRHRSGSPSPERWTCNDGDEIAFLCRSISRFPRRVISNRENRSLDRRPYLPTERGNGVKRSLSQLSASSLLTTRSGASRIWNSPS